MIRERIEEKLRAAFQPVFLEVVDESYRHNVPAGSESHFKVVLVSDRFTGERFLNRHRMIYSTLAEELSTTVHALALHTYTIKEWEALQDTIFASPPGRFVLSGFCAFCPAFRRKLPGNCEKIRDSAQ